MNNNKVRQLSIVILMPFQKCLTDVPSMDHCMCQLYIKFQTHSSQFKQYYYTEEISNNQRNKQFYATNEHLGKVVG